MTQPNRLFEPVTFSISHFQDKYPRDGCYRFNDRDSQKILNFIYDCADSESLDFFKVLDMSEMKDIHIPSLGIAPARYFARQYVWLKRFRDDLNFVWAEFKNNDNGQLKINQHALFLPESVYDRYWFDENPRLILGTQEMKPNNLCMSDVNEINTHAKNRLQA